MDPETDITVVFNEGAKFVETKHGNYLALIDDGRQSRPTLIPTPLTKLQWLHALGLYSARQITTKLGHFFGPDVLVRA